MALQAELQIARAEAFKQPAFKEWIVRADVQEILIQGALDEHAGTPVPPQTIESLVTSYVNHSFEDKAQAESDVRLVLAWLRVWTAEAMSPTLDAELARHSAGRIVQKLDAVAALAKNAVPLVTKAAEEQLNRILRSRSVDGEKTQRLLLELWGKFADRGEYAQSSIEVQGKVAYWLARVAAGGRRHEEAIRWRDEMSNLAIAEPTSLDALFQFSAGNNDAALQLARKAGSADGRGILLTLLVQINGESSAIDYFSEQAAQANFFTAHGYRHFIALLLKSYRFAEAEKRLAQLDANAYLDCIELHFFSGVVAALEILPKEKRQLAIDIGWQACASETLDGPAAYQSAERARSHFDTAIELARECNSEKLEKNCTFWSFAMRLILQSSRGQAVEEIQQRMALADADAIHYAVIALMFGVPFDTNQLETQLTRKALAGGLNGEELTTRFLLLRARATPQAVVNFIDQHFARLAASQAPGAVAVALIEALSASGNTERARSVLQEHKDEIGEDEPRCQLAILAAAGLDPSGAAIEQYRQTNHIGDLSNVVNSLKMHKRWGELVPFSREQYARTPNFANAHAHVRALRNSDSPPTDQLAFLREVEEGIGLEQSLRSTKAWALFDAGHYLQSLAENDRLLVERDDPNDLGLDLNLAIATGAWQRFPQLLVRADRIKEKMPATGLVAVARIAGLTNATVAEELLFEAVRKEPENPDILVAAYTTMVALGQDSKGFDWMRRAIALSKEDGPVHAYSFRELEEFVRVQAESWTDREARLRKSEIPIHLVPWLFNIPLADFLIGMPKSNGLQGDFRMKRPIPVWQGARPAVSLPKETTLALDVTSLYVLQRLGILTQTIEFYSSIRIAPGLMALLLNEHKKVAYHQPSRIASAKPLLALVHAKALRETVGVKDPVMGALLGAEIGALVAAAKRDLGWYVRTRPLYEAASSMEVFADLGENSIYVKDPSDLASWLVRSAAITKATSTESLRVLGFEEREVDGTIGPPAAVYLDPVAIEPLHSSGLLAALLASGVPVYVHESAVRDWQALVDTEPHTAAMSESIGQVREALHVGIMSGHVKAVSPSATQKSESRELTDLTLTDLIASAGEFEAIVLDDRMLASALTVTSDAGKSAKTATTFDVLRTLTEDGVISAERRRELIHRLRADCFYCVPVSTDELVCMIRDAVSEGVFSESAELKTLRQYLARLGATNKLCTPGDLAFMDTVWMAGAATVDAIWADANLGEDAVETSSTWVVRNILSAADLLADDLEISHQKTLEVESERGRQLVLAGARYGSRRPAYVEWLQHEYFDRLSPGSVEILEKVGRKLEEIVIAVAGDEID